MALQTNATFNLTLYNDPDLCTLKTCPIDWATIRYVPSLGGNAFYLALFIALLLIQTYLGIRHRTWSFFIALLGGEILEVIGYIGRIELHYNIFVFNSFLIYLICLTIGPCFLSAACYLCFSRVIVIYGEHLARFKPKTYTIIFITCDIFSLVLQSAGGALASGATDGDDTGVNLMIAGLAWQVVSLATFMLLCADYARSVKKAGSARFLKSRESMGKLGVSAGRMQYFMGAVMIATLTIFIRSCFRVAELQQGFDGKLANQQVSFMILEGAMTAIASIALTVAHPGLLFGAFWNLTRAREAIQSTSQMEPSGTQAKDSYALHARELSDQ